MVSARLHVVKDRQGSIVVSSRLHVVKDRQGPVLVSARDVRVEAVGSEGYG